MRILAREDRARKNFMVHWEGNPTGFALQYPYVLAFEPTFVEIRHVETGLLAQIIKGNNLRLLFAHTSLAMTTIGQPSAYGGRGPQQQYGMNGQGGFTEPRNVIILLSDERVMTLRLAAPVAQTPAR